MVKRVNQSLNFIDPDTEIGRCKRIHIESNIDEFLEKNSNSSSDCGSAIGSIEWDFGILNKTEVEKDVGVFFQNNMKWEAQSRYCCCRANKILGMISKNFKYLDESIVKNVYTGLVRAHIDYAIWAWNPTFEKESWN
ncbi:unnamed protein product [Brachionus calyciflorus]|uniref:Uncharacterized protein n=1 Tax=Brachionus calyciflorus TaxID=104777 RepID=A0A813M365_9BILA|nr:unnamed protein product [Brachionus calyciflorus]